MLSASEIVLPAGFDVTANPFAVLGVSLRDRWPDITAAMEQQIAANPAAATAAQAARRALLASRSRLRAELRWLSDCAPARAKMLLPSLAQGILPADLTDLPPLTQANAAAHCCGSTVLPGADGLVAARLLLQGQERLEPASLLETINLNRLVAGLPVVPPSMLEEELASLRGDHAEAVLRALLLVPDPGAALLQLWQEWSNPSRTRLLIADVADRYRSCFAGSWARQERAILLAADQWRLPEAPETAADLDQLLGAWTDQLRPLMVMDAARGLDEPTSHRLGKGLLRLAGQLAERDAARAEIMRALVRHHFAALPDLLLALQPESPGPDPAASPEPRAEAMPPPLFPRERPPVRADFLADRRTSRAARAIARQRRRSRYLAAALVLALMLGAALLWL